MPAGLAIGVVSQFVLVPLIYWPIFKLIGHQDVSAAARQLTDRATDPVGIVLLFLIVGLGAPFAEEIFFRGLTQRSLDRRWGAVVAVGVTAVFFALTHFELLQFPALLAFGLVLGVLAHGPGGWACRSPPTSGSTSWPRPPSCGTWVSPGDGAEAAGPVDLAAGDRIGGAGDDTMNRSWPTP